MILFIRRSAKIQCTCKSTEKLVFSLLIQKGKSLKVCSTICNACVKAMLASKILEKMKISKIFFLSTSSCLKPPSFLERLDGKK